MTWRGPDEGNRGQAPQWANTNQPQGPYPPQQQPGFAAQWMPPSASNGVGVASMVIGLVSCLVALIPFVGLMSFLIGAAAIILGIIGLMVKYRSRGAAITGLSTGAGSMVLALIITGAVSASLPRSSTAEGPSVAAAGSSASSAIIPSASATPSVTPTPTGPAKSARGNNVLQVGQGVSVNTSSGKPAVTFVVNAIQVDPQCTGSFVQQPENGHFVALDISAQTTPELAQLVFSHNFSFSPILWKAIAANGTTFNGNVWSFQASSCLPNGQELTSAIGPGENVHGMVILDVPTTSGVLVFDPYSGPNWEISYGG